MMIAAVVYSNSDVSDFAYIYGGRYCTLNQGHALPFVLFG